MLRITIGLQNYNGVACGVNFVKSVGQDIPEDWTVGHVQVKRLLALFPGTTVETVGVGKAVEPEPKPEPKPELKPDPVSQPEESEDSEEPEAAEEVETVEEPAETETEEVEETPTAEPVEEEVEEEVEELEEPEDKPLESGDHVLAHYKNEFRKGKVVKVLESGVVRVKIDGDDANYRVLDDDKVSKLDLSAAE